MKNLTFDFRQAETCDVACIGGGTAGVFASIASAKTGARTLLVEKNGIPGGTVTAAGVNYPGLFYAWGKRIVGGPCWEAIKRTEALGGANIPPVKYQPTEWWLQQIDIDRFLFASVMDEMLLEAGVDVRYHTMIAAAEETEDGVELLLTGKEGLYPVKARRVIDATGDANVASLMGFETVRSERLQPGTLRNVLEGYRYEDLDTRLIDENARKAVEEGRLKPYDFDFNGGGPSHTLANYKIDMHILVDEAADSRTKSRLEVKARLSLKRIIVFLKSQPGLERLKAVYVADECGVRETCRIVGKETMTREKYVSGYLYPDAVSNAFYPVDRHMPTGISQEILKPERVPTISYRAMLPKESRFTAVAGRSISCDADTQSAIRVQAPCMAMGQAAGVAAALAAKAGCTFEEVNYRSLLEGLKAIGAILPHQFGKD